jgi:outer membrane protein TolC
MKRSAALFLGLCFCLAGARAVAQELTLPRLLKAQAESSPDLKREEAALLKARAYYLEQAAFLYPTLTFAAPAGYSFSPFYSFYYTSSLSTTIANSSAWDFSPTLSLTQVLPTAGTLDLSVKNTLSIIDLGSPVDPFFAPFIPDTAYMDDLAVSLSLRQPIFFENAFAASLVILEETYKQAEARFRLARNGLVCQAARDYYGLVRLSNAARVAELTLAAARLACDDARRKLGTGSVSRLAALKEETRLKKAELDLFDAHSALRNESARIAAAYGLRGEIDVGAAAAPLVLPALPGPDEIRARAAALNPELLAGKDELAARKARVTTIKCDNAHTLTVGSSLILDSVNEYETDLWAALADPFNGSANPKLSFNFKLTFKLLDGGAAAARVRQAELDAEMSALALFSTEADVAGRVDRALDALERARLNAGYTGAAREAASQEFEAACKDFKLGQIAQLDLDRLELAFRAAELEDELAKSDLELARLELFSLMGDDLYALTTGEKP